MEPTHPLDPVHPGTEQQVVGVGEHHLGREPLEFPPGHPLDRTRGAHRHEGRRAHRAVRGRQLGGSGRRSPDRCG